MPELDILDTGKELVRRLRAAGHKAYFVGGCVRDAVMGHVPTECDIATSATPEQIEALFDDTVPVGASFGVVLVLCKGFRYEVATFRSDESYSDGRRPDRVVYTDDEQRDVRRRDFTMNALLYDPLEGKGYDYVGGLDDIERKLVRAIGEPDERFREDKLRMLRAVRFAARFAFEIEARTLEAIRRHASEITQVSRERIRDEIVKIVTQENPGRGLELLLETGLLEYVMPDVARMHGVEQPPEFHPEGDVFRHTCLVLERLREYYTTRCGLDAPPPEAAVAALLHDVGKPPTYSVSDRIRFNDHDRLGAEMAERICRELRFSNRQTAAIKELVRHHLRFKDAKRMKKSTLKRFLAMEDFHRHLALHWADCMGSHGNLDTYEFIRAKLDEYAEEELRPEPLLRGKDLIEMGYEPGPIFTAILDRVEEAQLQGEIADKEGARELVRRLFPLEEHRSSG